MGDFNFDNCNINAGVIGDFNITYTNNDWDKIDQYINGKIGELTRDNPKMEMALRIKESADKRNVNGIVSALKMYVPQIAVNAVGSITANGLFELLKKAFI